MRPPLRVLAWAVVVQTAMAGPVDAAQDALVPVIASVSPIDDGARDSSFVAFRRRAMRAIATCTAASLGTILATDTYRDPTSPGSFEYWRRYGTGIAGLCRALDRALVLGAVTHGDAAYCAPYASCFGGTPDSLPWGQYLIGVAEQTALRARPHPDAEILAEAPYPVLVDCRHVWPSCGRSAPDREGWSWVALHGKAGFVSNDQLRDQHEIYVVARRLPVGWRIVTIAAGD